MARAYLSRIDGHRSIPKIEVRGAALPERFYSQLLPFAGDTYYIIVNKELNRCFTRFAVAVELAGLLLGYANPGMRTVDIVKHLTGLRSGLRAERGDPLYAESMAQLVAIELLMPMSHRRRFEEMAASGVSPLDIATEFRVPQGVIEYQLGGAWKIRCSVHDTPNLPPSPPGSYPPEV